MVDSVTVTPENVYDGLKDIHISPSNSTTSASAEWRNHQYNLTHNDQVYSVCLVANDNTYIGINNGTSARVRHFTYNDTNQTWSSTDMEMPRSYTLSINQTPKSLKHLAIAKLGPEQHRFLRENYDENQLKQILGGIKRKTKRRHKRKNKGRNQTRLRK
jgi:hypothetical protein